jgi:hypothetical protein
MLHLKNLLPLPIFWCWPTIFGLQLNHSSLYLFCVLFNFCPLSNIILLHVEHHLIKRPFPPLTQSSQHSFKT